MQDRQQSHEDKRRHPRHSETVVTTYEIPSFEPSSLTLSERPCWLREVSEGGAMIETDRTIDPKTAIILTITLEGGDGADQNLMIRGETRWCRPTGDERVFHVGIEFSILSMDDRRIIRDYVANRLAPA